MGLGQYSLAWAHFYIEIALKKIQLRFTKALLDKGIQISPGH